MTGLSVEDGTLAVSNMLNNASSAKEVILSKTTESGEYDIVGPVEDEFDIVIRWAVTNSSCEQAICMGIEVSMHAAVETVIAKT